MNMWELQNWLDAWYVVAIFYIFICWLLPMLGMVSNKWANEGTPQENRFRYWEGVKFFALSMHVALVGTGLVIWGLESYIFI